MEELLITFTKKNSVCNVTIKANFKNCLIVNFTIFDTRLNKINLLLLKINNSEHSSAVLSFE